MMKILLPVDGSDCARRAAENLVTLARELREAPEVHLLHVHPPIPIGLVQAHVSPETIQRHYREESEAEMLAVRQSLEAADVTFQAHIHVGDAAPVIVKLAGELGCNLILMGTHGRGVIGNAMLGSVAAKVAHLAPCAVQLVK
ncbi:MAG: universal stress protein [Betaproteobacteria bacterium]